MADLDKPFRVLFLPTNCTGVNFWRMYQFSEKLNQFPQTEVAIYNWRTNDRTVGEWVSKFSQDAGIRGTIYALLKICDIAVLQYMGNPLILGLIAMFREEFGKKVLMELDDCPTNIPTYNPGYKHGFSPGSPMEKVIVNQMEMSDGMIVSTDYLKRLYKDRNDNIAVIPNSINFDKWKFPNKKRKKLRIGWIGGGNHEEDLRVLEKVAPRILDRYKDVEMYLVHGVPSYLKKVHKRLKYTLKWVDIEKYPKAIASYGFDIGLAPLLDSTFNRSKSNLRWLEYSALKIPTVASSVEPYKKSIVNGKTGFICNSEEEWFLAISELIDNQELRKTMGENAYNEVKNKYNIERTSKEYLKVLRRIANGQRKSSGRN